MKLQSAFKKDIRSLKTGSGAYEWWYFDAVSDDGNTELVIIFYEGNPFSRRYISRQLNGAAAKAEDFPAISISVYQNKEPIYYSFTEVPKPQADFGGHTPFAQIANHTMEGREEEGKCIYTLKLDEQLPSGDAISGRIRFESPTNDLQIPKMEESENHGHSWVIVQIRARVSAQIQCSIPGKKPNTIEFEGSGYHDHNEGSEPLKQQFEDWYWGRFHFEDATLIYYLKGEERQ
jgi:carotenoid 1,2-hydratase